MWLNPLKGDHLTLRQLDKTLPVDLETAAASEDNKKIERGSFVYISTGGTATGAQKFALYKSAQATTAHAVPYIALQGVNDFQAGMAGNVGQAPEAQGIEKEAKATGDNLAFINPRELEQTFRGPRITAVSVLQPAEWQTTAFAKKNAEGGAIADSSYYVGCPLTVDDNGMLTPFTNGHNIVGYVTAAPSKRWINDLGASADGARISGGNAKVISFSTAWIPVAVPAEGANPLAVGKPDVQKGDAAKPTAAQSNKGGQSK